ncbi:type II toxin-antitoxin system RelE/ParE family toxin [Photorhabdus khanii]|uniref:Type II toxin-antitoxin system RelE/ParE family toxin n=1 Tax=Photorhabdus khanii subsp. guanajuatensis TaxID=2100166 RepID=A0A4R4J395_9GAMM|nr:type II toxin-antitoxin system RelE/ParE family toxin [Photorhabdus khanii]TDB47967.1 type II toxin-antitoxin system RelE/ParE family toxin [Photorhabdus khanii subsp. guanajuatensis]
MFDIEIHEEALKEIQELPPALQSKMTRQIDKLVAFGTTLREPDTKPIRDGFFELRAKAGDIGRAIYVYQKGRRVFILKVFVKDTAKLPPAMLNAAANRLEEMLNGN